MTIQEAYRIYLCLRLHFLGETQGENGRVKKFWVPRSRILMKEKALMRANLIRLTKLYPDTTVSQFFLSNLVAGDEYAGVFDMTRGDRVLSEWLRRKASRQYLFQKDVRGLADRGWRDFVAATAYPTCPLYHEYLGGRITPETFVILMHLFNPLPTTPPDILCEASQGFVRAYIPFLRVPFDTYRTIVHDLLHPSLHFVP